MHGTQKLSLLDLSAGIVTPPTVIIDYPTYVACQQACSDSQNYRSYGEKKVFFFSTIDAFFLYEMHGT